MPTSLDVSARRAGAHCWAEMRLFEVLGAWVPTTAVPEAKLLFDRHSHHHAWRASQWQDRLPALDDVDVPSLIAAPPGPLGEALDRLAAFSTPVSRMAGTYRAALPRLWTGYERHRAEADALADGATLRALAIVAADVRRDWQEGEAALQSLIEGRDDALEAAEAVRAVEELLAAGTGPAGRRPPPAGSLG